MNIYARAGLLAAFILAAPAAAKEKAKAGSPAMAGELIIYEMTGFNGDYYRIHQDRTTVQTEWPIKSIAMHPGDKWEICARPRYRDCIEIGQNLPDASAVGIRDQIGSVRLVKAN
ncbi:MAG TPA: hypothetical protein VIT45_00790 [Allosphingosinicella sp.]